MTRRFQGLNRSAACPGEPQGGLYLVRVEKVQHHWDRKKPSYDIRLSVLEPSWAVGRTISGRLYCTPKTLWKLGWFLRDFGYDSELLRRDEVDEQAMLGLNGVVKISHAVVRGSTVLNLEAFAPASQWDEFVSPAAAQILSREALR